jgi:hypothetical protein
LFVSRTVFLVWSTKSTAWTEIQFSFTFSPSRHQKWTMGNAGYVSVCMQLYCMLVSAVFHYMFWPTWPSSRV